MDFLLTALAILVLRIGQDSLFLAKIDAFNRENQFYSTTINFIEAMYGITVIKIILDLMSQNVFYILVYGIGSICGGLISRYIKGRLDDRLEGQKKFYARIALENDQDRSALIEILRERDFDFTVEVRDYINGHQRTVIQGPLDNRKRMHELKSILRDRSGKLVTILRAEDVYMLR
jgi:hypothetical protein